MLVFINPRTNIAFVWVSGTFVLLSYVISLFPGVTLMCFCDLCCNALTLSWDLCCGQNDPERICKLYWISQLQCPENIKSHMNPSTFTQSQSVCTIEPPYWLSGHMHIPSDKFLLVHQFCNLLCIYCKHHLFVKTPSKTKQQKTQVNMTFQGFGGFFDPMSCILHAVVVIQAQWQLLSWLHKIKLWIQSVI